MKDPTTDALGGRKRQLLKLSIHVADPETVGLAPDSTEPQVLPSGVSLDPNKATPDNVDEEGTPNRLPAKTIEDEELDDTGIDPANDDDMDMEGAMQGPGSKDQIKQEFANRAPRSLGERMRLMMANKK